MTDRQRLLLALLNERESTRTDLANMRLLEMTAVLDLVGATPAHRSS